MKLKNLMSGSLKYLAYGMCSASLYVGMMSSSMAKSVESNVLVNQANLDSQTAVKMAQAAVQQCHHDGYLVSASVVDASGVPLVQIRDNFASPHTLNSSLKKAFTSVALKKPTSIYANMIASKPELTPLRDMDERLLFLGGGFPIEINGKIVGGIGVGGAPGAHLDESCAQAGLSQLK